MKRVKMVKINLRLKIGNSGLLNTAYGATTQWGYDVSSDLIAKYPSRGNSYERRKKLRDKAERRAGPVFKKLYSHFQYQKKAKAK